MSDRNSGGKLEKFFEGKGFYIVLFLCAAVIGVSAWMLASGNRTMLKEAKEANNPRLDNKKVETVILPPAKEEVRPVLNPQPPLPKEEPEKAAETMVEEPAEKVAEEPAEEAVETLQENTADSNIYLWPMSGEVERGHDTDGLSYDMTLQDWRAHEGIDILSPLGTTVTAAHSGTVESVYTDSLYGTCVRVSHGDGTASIYANLADPCAVSEGDVLQAGDVVGAVGNTAICESGQSSHLHFAIEVNGESVDPTEYLPA